MPRVTLGVLPVCSVLKGRMPRVILGYYLSAVSSREGCPRRVRADMGTENGHVEQLQKFLRRNGEDNMAGQKSFLYGTSINNQRIEAWWCLLRKQCVQHWLDVFHKDISSRMTKI